MRALPNPEKRDYRNVAFAPQVTDSHIFPAKFWGMWFEQGKPLLRYSSVFIPRARMRRYKWLRSSPSASAVRVICHWFSSSLRRINSRS
jgi:hypothetical protein